MVGKTSRKGQVGYPPQISDPKQVTSGGDHWTPVQTSSFMDPPESHLLVATETEAHMVSKRAVRIILECFLVFVLAFQNI